MGGTKKPSAAQLEKKQESDKSKEQGGKKDKKDKKQDKAEKKAEITVFVNEDQALQLIKSNKYLTAPELARQTGVKISAANACLVNLVKKGIIKRAGGFSGHWVYQQAG